MDVSFRERALARLTETARNHDEHRTEQNEHFEEVDPALLSKHPWKPKHFVTMVCTEPIHLKEMRGLLKVVRRRMGCREDFGIRDGWCMATTWVSCCRCRKEGVRIRSYSCSSAS